MLKEKKIAAYGNMLLKNLLFKELEFHLEGLQQLYMYTVH